MKSHFPELCPEAVFDVLATISHLEPRMGRVFLSEIHLFTYLACLLYLYSGRPVADWNYSFAGTPLAAPFSADVERAIENLYRIGYIETDSAQQYGITEAGQQEYTLLAQLSIGERVPYIAGACDSVLSLPIGVVHSALNYEPALRRATASKATRRLLERVDLDSLYQQFAALAEALDGVNDELMVPAVVWLTYLTRHGNGPVGQLEILF